MHTPTRFADLFTPAPARRPVREALADWMPVARMMGLTLGDGTAIESVRLGDGTAIEEIRKGDGTVLWSGEPDIPDSVVYNFETGDTSRWDSVSNLTASQDRVFAGSYSGSTSTDTTTPAAVAHPYDEGLQPSEFEYYWQETNNGNGGGLRVFDESGSEVLSFTSDSPEWVIKDANGTEQVAGGNINEWIRFTATIDWSNETFDVDIEALDSGSTFTDTGRPLINSTNIYELRLVPYDSESGGFETGNMLEAWLDDIGVYA